MSKDLGGSVVAHRDVRVSIVTLGSWAYKRWPCHLFAAVSVKCLLSLGLRWTSSGLLGQQGAGLALSVLPLWPVRSFPSQVQSRVESDLKARELRTVMGGRSSWTRRLP